MLYLVIYLWGKRGVIFKKYIGTHSVTGDKHMRKNFTNRFTLRSASQSTSVTT